MEKEPTQKNPTENKKEQELSFNEQLALVNKLLDTVRERRKFIESHGGDFDTFAESWQHVGNNRLAYEILDEDFEKARKEFDELVPDKKTFVKKLRSVGEGKLADGIVRMFGVPKDSLFSRIFKK